MRVPHPPALARRFYFPLMIFSIVAASPSVAAPDNDSVMANGFEASESVTPLEGPCGGFYPEGFTLLEGRLNPPTVAVPKPAKGSITSDSAFGTCVVRATEHDVEPPETFARNDYSRRQPFNADNSRVLVYGSGGWWHLYDANTLQYLKKLAGPAGDAEIQWDPTDPNTLYYVDTNGGMALRALDIRSNTSRIISDFAGKLPWGDVRRMWTKSEGSPSRDNRYWGFMAETNDFNLRGLVVYDTVQDRVVGTRSTTSRPDHVSMTPSGRWFVPSDDDEGTWAWSPDFTTKKKLHQKSEHSDIAIGPNGHDYYVAVDFQSSAGDVFFVDIDACPAVPANADPASTPVCPRTVLFEDYVNGAATSLHISGKAYAKPGWVVVSSYATTKSRDGTWPWFTNKIFAIELNANPRVYGLGINHYADCDNTVTNYQCYWSETQGAVNRDLTRVMFNSTWDARNTTDVDTYMIELAPNMIPAARP